MARPRAPIRNRTVDLLLTMETLYRLSYWGLTRLSRAETGYTGLTLPEKSASRSTIAIPAWGPQFAYGELPALPRVQRLVPFHRISGQCPIDRLDWVGSEHRLCGVCGVGPVDWLSSFGCVSALGRQRGVADVGGECRRRFGDGYGALASDRNCGGPRSPGIHRRGEWPANGRRMREPPTAVGGSRRGRCWVRTNVG